MSGIQNLLLGGSPVAAAAEDPDFEYVTLLLPGNGTNGAQNNTFLDSSANNFTITRNGNTTQGTFSPFSRSDGYWSNYFDGSSYIYTADSADYAMGTGDFTVQGWVYSTTTGVDQYLLGQSNSAGSTTSTAVGVYKSSTNKIAGFFYSSGTLYMATSAADLPLNQWTHFAFVRDGATCRLYVNGIQDGTVSVSTVSVNDSSNQFAIGRLGEYTSNYWYGYVSNISVIKGTCSYPNGTTFTVPTTPLATGTTNQKLLTCTANRFIDSNTATTAKTITVNGNPSVQAFSPFNPTAAYSAATNGGSGYFDGTGDYLTITNDAAFAPNTYVSLECWVYFNSLSANRLIVGRQGMWINYSYTGIGTTADKIGFGIYNGSTWYMASGTTTITTNQWYHVVGVRDSGTLRIYINGVQEGTASFVGSPASYSTDFAIGASFDGTQPITGYLSGVRYCNGSTSGALPYTGSSFTVPTSPPTNTTDTKILANFTNAGIYDAAAMNDLETVGNAQISTAQSKFGGSSISFDGTGDSLDIGQTTPFLSVWTGNFTIECWAYTNNLSAQHIVWANKGTDSSGYNAAYINTNGSIGMGKAGVNEILSASSTWTSGQWNHLAFVRNGSNLTIYYNGTSVATTASASTYLTTTATGFSIGKSFQTSPAYFNGYINDFRVTYGVARYTANFTAPTAAFPLF